MAYRLEVGESVEDGIRRVIAGQVKGALRDLANAERDRADTIHRVRKRCKKIRAVLRLVRNGLGEAYATENAWYRDAARTLSGLRDAEAMIETCDALASRSAGHADVRAIRPIRAELEARRHALMADTDRVDALLRDFASAMIEGRGRLRSLDVEGDGHEVVLAGMRRTYARASRAMDAAYDDPVPETFHAWRKRVTYHWHDMRLLRDAWPAVVRARQDEADKLHAALGYHHNLSILRARVMADPASFANDEAFTIFIRLADQWAERIQHYSRPLGGCLFAEKGKQFARRFGVYLEIWSMER
jgi:CHAD domain